MSILLKFEIFQISEYKTKHNLLPMFTNDVS